MRPPASFRPITRNGVTLHLFEAPYFCKIPPVVGPMVQLPLVAWQVHWPDGKKEVAGGFALTQHGAERKAWKAYDHWLDGRLRWKADDPFTDSALCRDWVTIEEAARIVREHNERAAEA